MEHAHWLTEEQVDMMAERDVFLVPTLLVNTLSVEGADEEPLPEDVYAWLLRAQEDKLGSMERARKAGVKIAAGTDAGFLVYHGQNARELEEFVKLGFTPMEAIVAATKVGAECLDMGQKVGTIEPGKYADLVILDGDPLVDIRTLQEEARIVQVFKGGVAVK